MSKGVIYILTNPSFPDYIKIGYAANLEKRLKQLNRSETIPFAFRAYAVYEVDSSLTDKELHKLIDTLNPDLRSIETFDGKERVKEFYAMSAEDAYGLLESIARISGTESRLKRVRPEGHEIIDEKIAEEVRETVRRGPFRFSQVGIPVGSELAFVDDPTITVTVEDDRHIRYQNMTTSLSALARDLKRFDHPVQGTLWFTYEGEILDTRRKRIEKTKQ
ncbi:MAG: GIY-YIG nuclease family protein [Oscillospiraceae bacterium]|nr:GIY-YIG nuclease family protein [Oscillospiraceae bacterium]